MNCAASCVAPDDGEAVTVVSLIAFQSPAIRTMCELAPPRVTLVVYASEVSPAVEMKLPVPPDPR